MERRRLRMRIYRKPSGAFMLAAMAMLFAVGAAVGFLLDCRWPVAGASEELILTDSAALTPFLIARTFWNHFRWLLFAVLLEVSGSGVWLLPVLLFVRGVLFGYSYTALFDSQPGLSLFLHYLPTALFDCAPLLLLAALGGLRLVDGVPSEAIPLTRFSTLLILSAFCAIFYCFAALWLLPLLSL